MIIQGFTSVGKSFLSNVTSIINKRECLSTALSEHTTTEDLLGRDIIKKDSSIRFYSWNFITCIFRRKNINIR